MYVSKRLISDTLLTPAGGKKEVGEGKERKEKKRAPSPHLPGVPLGLPGLSQLDNHLQPLFLLNAFFLITRENIHISKKKKKILPTGASGGGEQAGEGGNARLMHR